MKKKKNRIRTWKKSVNYRVRLSHRVVVRMMIIMISVVEWTLHAITPSQDWCDLKRLHIKIQALITDSSIIHQF